MIATVTTSTLGFVIPVFMIRVFRSTPKSPPNNMGQMSVCPYVRPSTKSFSDSDEIWYAGEMSDARWYAV